MSEFSVPMSPHSPLKRSPVRRGKKKRKPQVRVGKVSGTVRLSGPAMEKLRERRYVLDNGRCQWRVGEPDACNKWLPLYGSVFNRAHLVHLRSRGAGGGDTLDNTVIGCFLHHIETQHQHGTKGWPTDGI